MKAGSLFYHREKPSEWAEHDPKQPVSNAFKKQTHKEKCIFTFLPYYASADTH